jgi:hypothetical protein
LRAAEAQKRWFSYTQSTKNGFSCSWSGDGCLSWATLLHEGIVGSASHLQLFSQRYVMMMSQMSSCYNNDDK